jgi:hypothetical protein
VTPSPIKRYRRADLDTPEDSAPGSGCKICGEDGDISFWIGCGHKNPITKACTCQYWVHQNCVGLYFASQSKLGKVPFYCKRHAPEVIEEEDSDDNAKKAKGKKGKGKGKSYPCI